MVSISQKGAFLSDISVPQQVNASQTFIVSLSVKQYTYDAYSIYTYLELSENTYDELSGYYSWDDYSGRTWGDVADYEW